MCKINFLEERRLRLIDNWLYASGQEKIKILVNIIDIEDKIDFIKKTSQTTQKKSQQSKAGNLNP